MLPLKSTSVTASCSRKMLKKGDGEAVESFLFSAVDWRECLDTVRFPRKPKKISCAHGIALFILFSTQPTTADDTGGTT